MSKEYNITFEHKEKIGEKNYIVRPKGKEQKVTFKEFEKDKSKAETKVKLEYSEDDGKTWQDCGESDVTWNGGWVMNGMKIDKKELKTGVVLSKEIEPGLGMGTLTITSWIGLVIIFIAIGALIWYWISSSKSEDKEEESL